MGSPCHLPLSSFKYFEVLPRLMTHDSCLFNNTFIHSVNSVVETIFSSIAIKEWWLTALKAFSIYVVSKKLI